MPLRVMTAQPAERLLPHAFSGREAFVVARPERTKKTGCPSQPDTPFGKKRALSRYWMAEPPEGVALSDMPLSDAVLDCQIVPVVFVPK
jgi:hypothetical protein